MERPDNVEDWEDQSIDKEMRGYNLTVLGINETHWIQAGQQRLDKREMVVYSGHEENAPHTHGVALMLSEEVQNALIGCECHGS
ncbi:unnamed protein product [Schistosoma margrebowiei]|uniref:Uncharacterized protein n=1 Tax=Schistosoma margrebowiei TaxID=48269 RepID=A0A183LNR6_9TREM|nr:unnamed protein product [Schistosoma margrebowiei]